MKNNPTFEVEAVTTLNGRGVLVFAKYLGQEEFTIQPVLELNGCKIIGWDIPRTLDNDGNPRFDNGGFNYKLRMTKINL